MVNVDSFVLKPGSGGVTVCVPQGIGNPAVSMVAMDPAMTVSRPGIKKAENERF